MKRTITILCLILNLGLCCQFFTVGVYGQTATNEIQLLIKPSVTDKSITLTDAPHLVMYDSEMEQGKLLLFLPGTNGIPDNGPKDLFKTAIEQGYRVINLSYINTPAIAAICKGENLVANANCAEDFRNKRVYGTDTMDLIVDGPQDAIVPRLVKLLEYLIEADEAAGWQKYLVNGEPNWKIIALAGQSQGGGMSAFIAQKKLVARVIDFSGGWDYSAKGKIANWYYNESVTPLDDYYGTYNVQEPLAKTIAETYKAIGIPESQVYAFDHEVTEGRKAHSDGVRNLTYKKDWIELLGDGRLATK